MAARFFQDKKEKDLFADFQIADKKIRKKVKLHLPRLKNTLNLSYENIIFIAIGFVMASIIFFSLGVEKGRHDVNHIKKVERKEKIEKKVKVKIPKVKAQKKETLPQDEYIIQIAAFREKSSAKEELSKLGKDGYTASIKKSGGYYQLYIAGFSKKKEAEKILEGLQKKYKDCYIKKI